MMPHSPMSPHNVKHWYTSTANHCVQLWKDLCRVAYKNSLDWKRKEFSLIKCKGKSTLIFHIGQLKLLYSPTGDPEWRSQISGTACRTWCCLVLYCVLERTQQINSVWWNWSASMAKTLFKSFWKRVKVKFVDLLSQKLCWLCELQHL